jgi:DNA polymerase III delta prime subunit
MHSFMELYKQRETLHHAYLLVTHKIGEEVEKLKNFVEEALGIKTSGNPDFQHSKYETMTIEDARVITENEMRKAVAGGKKIFVIETDFITEEAQNALLKVFEEPRDGTHFFIFSPQDTLLPTLKSRMMVLQGEKNENQSSNLLKLSMDKRIAKVKEIIEGISDEEKTKQDAIVFVNGVEAELHKEGVENKAQSLKACEFARKALLDRGAPVKMILENLVLSI